VKTCDPSARQVEAGNYVGRRPLEFSTPSVWRSNQRQKSSQISCQHSRPATGAPTATLALFCRGFPIDPAVVRAGYREMYRGFADVIGDDGDPLDRSGAMARNLARRPSRASMSRQWEKRLRRDRETDLEDVLSAGFTGVIAGEQPTLPGVAALLRAAALDEGQDPAEVAGVLGRLQVDGLIEAIETAEDTIPPSQRAEVQSRMVGWLQAHPEVIVALGPHFGEA
jgi:hypothetical protein